MNINQFKVPSFCGSVTRQIYFLHDEPGEDASAYKNTGNDYLVAFDNEIARIKARKENAIALDTFMHSKEVTEALAQLPETEKIDIVTNINSVDEKDPSFLLYLDDNEGYDDVDAEDMTLYSDVFDDENCLNKKGILSWIQELAKIVNGSK